MYILFLTGKDKKKMKLLFASMKKIIILLKHADMEKKKIKLSFQSEQYYHGKNKNILHLANNLKEKVVAKSS